MLNNIQKRHLRSLAHAKKPVVITGGGGLTPAVLNEIDSALSHHELIKVRINAEDRDARIEMIDHICKNLRAELVQRIGHIATLYRRNPEASRLQLP